MRDLSPARPCLSQGPAPATSLTIMFWPRILSLLVIWCTGLNSQQVISQPPSASVSPGSTVKFSCVMSSGLSISSYHVSWYQQKPGNPPRYLLRYYSDSNKHQGSGVPSRFSGSKDTSSNTCYLNVAGASAEDEAVYYCATWHSSAWHSDAVRWGNQTKTSYVPQGELNCTHL
ncbi:PREDICTED: immunoglobulin omega chain-like [Gekko japonicus]|uniref:immunoglobulin omega chain-like n=1 Tax=Gekko japonicus TaxID=146911 RepID=UPI00074FD826|nr:PREDICTED: immunoglobulin omega chain-like [Gekko japonicus]